MKNKTNLIAISGKAGSGKSTVGLIIQYLLCSNKENVKINDIIISNEYDWWLEEQSNFEIKQFSTKLKQIVSILTGIPIEDLEKQEVKNRVLGEEWWYWKVYSNIKKDVFEKIPYKNENGFYDRKENYKGHILIKPTVRQLLQEIGTDAMRNVIHPSIWVNALFSDYREKVDFDNNLPMNKNWIITDLRFKNEKKAIKDRGGITIRVNRYNRNDYIVKSKKGGGVEHFRKHEHPSETALDSTTFDYVIENNGSIEDLIESVKEILIKEKLIL